MQGLGDCPLAAFTRGWRLLEGGGNKTSGAGGPELTLVKSSVATPEYNIRGRGHQAPFGVAATIRGRRLKSGRLGFGR